MSSDEVLTNISNAFEVVRKTYENIEKLFSELDRISYESGFEPYIPHFLRWRSDRDYRAWLIQSFIKVYQKKVSNNSQKSKDVDDNSLYAVEISFEEEKPYVTISKFTYKELASWGRLSVSDHWVFHWPVYDDTDFVSYSLGDNMEKAVPKNDEVSEKYRGLKETVSKEIVLTELTVNSLKDLIFNEMKRF